MKPLNERIDEALDPYRCKYHQSPGFDNLHGCTDCYNTGYILDNPEIALVAELSNVNFNLKYQLTLLINELESIQGDFNLYSNSREQLIMSARELL